MGAEPWGEWVPYQEDIGRALRELQEDVLARGAYRRPDISSGLELLDQTDFFEAADAEREELIEEYGFSALREPLRRIGPSGLRRWLIERAAAPRPESLEELRLLVGLDCDGTASALDMDGISAEPEIGSVCAVPASELIRLYGTARPTRAAIQRDMGFYEGIGRGQGAYLIAYDGDRPDTIFFAGYSAD